MIICSYRILEADSIDNLETLVNEYLQVEPGWEPAGQVVRLDPIEGERVTRYLQTLIRRCGPSTYYEIVQTR